MRKDMLESFPEFGIENRINDWIEKAVNVPQPYAANDCSPIQMAHEKGNFIFLRFIHRFIYLNNFGGPNFGMPASEFVPWRWNKFLHFCS